jgi:hypothetical protein
MLKKRLTPPTFVRDGDFSTTLVMAQRNAAEYNSVLDQAGGAHVL